MNATTCPDLRALAGTKFRLGHDHGRPARLIDDPWLLTIRCRTGHVYPHSADRLAFASDSRGGVARAVAALPGAVVEQDASDGFNVSFPVALWPQVAELVKPRRRRQMTPEQRQASADRLARFAFPRTSDAPNESPIDSDALVGA